MTKIFLNGILAGVFIGIAGTVFLATPHPGLGAFLFGFGLLTILCYKLKLFTGAVGYLACQGRGTFPYLGVLGCIWLGNLLGCFAVGTLVRTSRTLHLIEGRAIMLCDQKLADSPASILALSFFCGILMYVAVETFRREELHAVLRTVVVFLCVVIFILSGFEHSIAAMYYFSVAGKWSFAALGCVALMTLGNSLGGMLMPVADKFRRETAPANSTAPHKIS
ncbi:MAG: formate/nitrite transporter family protein [Victivallaceae bacterium]|nr:formate/nitrite transporter family protein [Victivallaceae bacterium]